MKQCCWTCKLFKPATTAKGNPTRQERGRCGWRLPRPDKMPMWVSQTDYIALSYALWGGDGLYCPCYEETTERGEYERQKRPNAETNI